MIISVVEKVFKQLWSKKKSFQSKSLEINSYTKKILVCMYDKQKKVFVSLTSQKKLLKW